MSTLLCVLDWGLGHAARSLALAEQLRADGEKTDLASCGRALKFLRRELPGETIHELPPYAVRYPTGNMPFNVAVQLPKWLRTIYRERRRTAELVQELGADRVISDSRFGCYVPGVKSILLTHQLHPIFGFAPMSLAYVRYLRRFDEIWVPDHPGSPLSGELSAPRGYRNVRFIGPLSRLKPTDPAPTTWRTVSLLSGPEPMRSQLETTLLRQLPALAGPHLLIRGIPDARDEQRENITVKGFADAHFLAQNLPVAEYIICRAGYSTLMDLDRLAVSAKLILIPTPGQTEQAYLARTQVQRKDGATVFSQRAIKLSTVL
ncbi:MAG: glycosyltransferase [Bacteroidota bacterium]